MTSKVARKSLRSPSRSATGLSSGSIPDRQRGILPNLACLAFGSIAAFFSTTLQVFSKGKYSWGVLRGGCL
jgi:hypothetical protein